MPKTEIDYSNTIIYKITCRDVNMKDVYIGHTTNFVQRKHAHKQSCNNSKSSNYNCKLYNVIRNNGGWTNWTMEIINFFNCKDHYEARKKEQEYFISLNATLNSIEPLPKPKILISPVDKKVLSNETINNIDINKTLIVHSHNSIPSFNYQTPIVISSKSDKYVCNKCDVICKRKSEWLRHTLTKRHSLNGSQMETKLVTINEPYICSKCNKTYVTNSGLWKHKKICVSNKEDDVKTLTAMVIELLKSNKELQQQMLEVRN